MFLGMLGIGKDRAGHDLGDESMLGIVLYFIFTYHQTLIHYITEIL